MSQIIVLARAEWDLEDRHEYFEVEELGLDAKFLRAFEEGIERIGHFPHRYAKYWRNIRTCPLKPFKIGAF